MQPWVWVVGWWQALCGKGQHHRTGGKRVQVLDWELEAWVWWRRLPGKCYCNRHSIQAHQRSNIIDHALIEPETYNSDRAEDQLLPEQRHKPSHLRFRLLKRPRDSLIKETQLLLLALPRLPHHRIQSNRHNLPPSNDPLSVVLHGPQTRTKGQADLRVPEGQGRWGEQGQHYPAHGLDQDGFWETWWECLDQDWWGEEEGWEDWLLRGLVPVLETVVIGGYLFICLFFVFLLYWSIFVGIFLFRLTNLSISVKVIDRLVG